MDFSRVFLIVFAEFCQLGISRRRAESLNLESPSDSTWTGNERVGKDFYANRDMFYEKPAILDQKFRNLWPAEVLY